MSSVQVELRDPSEYPAEGVAQWNDYPFVRAGEQHSDGAIQVGARAEDIYVLNLTEAEAFAADILAAVAWVRARQ